MPATTGSLGGIVRQAHDYPWGHFLYVSRPIDECWNDTWAAVVEIDRYEDEPDPVTIVGVDYHPCLDIATVRQIRDNVFAQLPNPSDDLLVAALKQYYRLDGFMAVTLGTA